MEVVFRQLAGGAVLGSALSLLALAWWLSWSRRTGARTFAEVLAAEARSPGGFGLFHLLLALKYLLYAPLPVVLAARLPQRWGLLGVPAFLGAAGFLAMSLTMLLQTYSFAYLSRLYGRTAAEDERRWAERVARWAQLGLLGSGYEGAAYLLACAWILAASHGLWWGGARAMALAGAVYGIYSALAMGYILLSPIYPWRRDKLLPTEPIYLMELAWLAWLGVFLWR